MSSLSRNLCTMCLQRGFPMSRPTRAFPSLLDLSSVHKGIPHIRPRLISSSATRLSKGSSNNDSSNDLHKLLSDLYDDFEKEPEKEDPPKSDLKSSIRTKFDEYTDDGPIIYDVEEERKRIENQMLQEDLVEDKDDPFKGFNLALGERGVFEVEELVDILRKENCKDICVIDVDKAINYVDYMVIVTCRSARHVQAVSEFVYKLIKRKTKKRKDIPEIEGKGRTPDWIALDLGNIALHFFTKNTREKYDIESLWCLGSEMDELCRSPQIMSDLDSLETHDLLKDLEPLK